MRPSNKHDLSLANLKTLIAVAKEKGVPRAAKKLGLSVSRVYGQLNELREYFGCMLRDGEGKNARISTEGQQLVEIAASFFASLEGFQESLGKRLVSVKIGAGDSLIHLAIAPQLGGIQQGSDFEKTEIHISDLGKPELIHALRNYSIDFGIFREEFGKKESLKMKNAPEEKRLPLKYVELGIYNYAIFVSKELLRKSSHISELPFASKRIHWETNLIERAQKKRLKIKVKVWCSNLPQVIRLVQSGNYAAILPFFSKGLLPEKDFKDLPADFLNSQTYRVVLAYNPDLLRIKGKILRPFLDLLTERLEKVLRYGVRPN